MMQRRMYHFTGRVQGVGFRYTVQNLAQQYAVTGYVKNLPDGRVELLLEGDEPEMDALIQAIQQKMEGFIRKMALNTAPATGEFRGFSIRH